MHRIVCALASLMVLVLVQFASADDALEVLARTVDEGLDDLNDVDRGIIQFWSDTIRSWIDDDGSGICTASQLRELEDRIESDVRNSQMTDVRALYNITEGLMIKSCSKRVEGPYEKLDHHALFNLGWAMMGLRVPGPEPDPENLRYIAENMRRIVSDLGFPCTNSSDFIAAWRRGPCSSSLQLLEQPDMQPLVDYIEILDYTRERLDGEVQGIPIVDSELGGLLEALWPIRFCLYFNSEQALTEAWNTLQ